MVAATPITLVAGTVPGTPSAGNATLYFDSTSKLLKSVNDGGTAAVYVELTTSQTMTNKKLDSSCSEVDATDTTKTWAVSLSGMTTGVTLTWASSQATSQTLTVPVIRQAETLAIRPPTLGLTHSDPTGTTNTTGLQMGLGDTWLITPQVTGKLMIVVTGNLTNSTATAGDGAKAQIRVGTGTAPTNGAALTGTPGAVGNIVSCLLERATASDPLGFACVAIVSGLTLGTQCWIDISIAAVGGGTGQAKNLSVAAFEL